MTITGWDIVLVAGVSLQATAMAYVYHPRWKVLVYSLPVPFTLASLSLGAPVGATHVIGLMLQLAYMHSVRAMHQVLRWPIVLSIAVAAGGYLAVGCALAGVVPGTDTAFWIAVGASLAVGVTFLFALPHRDEPGHRSPLPLYVKLPIMVGVIVALVMSKKVLAGFMTMFPMMGVITAYEARHSLWTLSRQVPVLLITFVPMIVCCRLLQGHIGLGAALAVGWAAFLAGLTPITVWKWKREGPQGPAAGEAS